MQGAGGHNRVFCAPRKGLWCLKLNVYTCVYTWLVRPRTPLVEGECDGSSHLSVLPVVLKRTRGLFKISASLFVSPRLRPREGTTQFIGPKEETSKIPSEHQEPSSDPGFAEQRGVSFLSWPKSQLSEPPQALGCGLLLSYPHGSSLPGQSWLPWAVSRGPQAPCHVGPFSREHAGLKGLSPLTDVTSFTNVHE